MKNIRYVLIIFVSQFILNSCSDDDLPDCPTSENISMKINGEIKQFHVDGWGIDLDNDNSGHTLSLQISTGIFSPIQDSYAITLKLPYKKTGVNIIEEFNYLRVQNLSSYQGDFVIEELKSSVTVNKNTCFSATFSGKAIINGNEIIINEGIIDHIYLDPFD